MSSSTWFSQATFDPQRLLSRVSLVCSESGAAAAGKLLEAVAALPCLYTGANQTTWTSLIMKGRKIGQEDDWIDIFDQVTKLLVPPTYRTPKQGGMTGSASVIHDDGERKWKKCSSLYTLPQLL